MAPPFVVKPAAEGSSVGVVIVPEHDLRPLTDRNESTGMPAAGKVERYIPGRELTCGIVASINCAVTRTRLEALRTLPSRT